MKQKIVMVSNGYDRVESRKALAEVKSCCDITGDYIIGLFINIEGNYEEKGNSNKRKSNRGIGFIG